MDALMTYPAVVRPFARPANRAVVYPRHAERPVASGWREIVIEAMDGLGCSEQDLECLLDRVERTR